MRDPEARLVFDLRECTTFAASLLPLRPCGSQFVAAGAGVANATGASLALL